MGIKKYKAITPGQRYKQSLDFGDIPNIKPEKSLTVPLKRSGGRNNQGRLTARNKGGGHKRKYRLIDFKRDKRTIPAEVESVEYDPNRSVNIALLKYADGERRYILAPLGVKTGDILVSGPNSEIKVGNALPLGNIPIGTKIHNVELNPGKGGQLVRSAGVMAQIIGREGQYVQVKLPSGEVRMFRKECYATMGQLGNLDHANIVYGKAGAKRWRGVRPHTRGTAMNPIDHPHGGGEGKNKGYKQPVSATGLPCKGYKTRKKNKLSDKYIIKRRKG